MSRIASRRVAEDLDTYQLRQQPDAVLLDAFLASGDEEAFAALVGRHGPLVLGVGRGLLRDAHDAEDVFQATFLVLARRAGSIRTRGALAAWLHGVASRLARKSREQQARRERRERAAAAREAVRDPDEVTWGELKQVLHAEIGRLPEREREALLACYWQEQTQEKAARQLGCPKTTLKDRLERAREKLRARLARRGVALSASLLALLLPRGEVPAAQARATARAVLGSGVPARAVVLAESLAAASLAQRIKALLPLVVLCGAFGGALSWHGGSGAEADGPGVRPAAQAAARKPPKEKGKERPEGEQLPTADLHGDPLPRGAVARLGTLRFRHGPGLRGIVYAGEWLVTWGRNDTVRVWDADGNCLRSLRAPKGNAGRDQEVTAVAASPDGRTVAVATAGSVILWDVETGDRRQHLDFTKAVRNEVAFSPDGKLLAAIALGGRVAVADVATGKTLRVMATKEQQLEGLRYGPDGKTIAVTSERRGLILDADGGKVLWETKASKKTGSRLLYSSDGSEVLKTAGRAGLLMAYNARTGKELHKPISLKDTLIHEAAFSPDKRWLAALVSNTPEEECRLVLIDPARPNRDPPRLVFDGLELPTAFAFSPGGDMLAAADRRSGVIRVATVKTRTEQPSRGHVQRVTGVDVSLDGGSVLTAGGDGRLRVWEAKTGKEVNELRGGGGHFAADPKQVVVYSGEAPIKVQVRDASTGELLRSFDLPAGTIAWPARSPGRTWLACGLYDGSGVLVDLKTGKKVRDLRAPVLAFSDDETRLLESRRDGRQVRLWNTDPWAELWDAVGAPRAGRIAPDRTLVALGDDSGFRLIDGQTGRVLYRVGDDRVWKDFVFSPDGKTIAAAGRSGDIALWEVATGRLRRVLRGHSGEVAALAFARDGRVLVSASADTTALVWDVRHADVPNADAVPRLWGDLASEDAARADVAVRHLVALKGEAVTLLGKRLKPAARGEDAEAARLVKELASDDPAVFKRAWKKLSDAGEEALPAIRKALDDKPTAEGRARLEALAGRLLPKPLEGEALRAVRAVEVLEGIGDAKARDLLKRLAEGQPGNRLTEEAAAALKRLKKRGAV